MKRGIQICPPPLFLMYSLCLYSSFSLHSLPSTLEKYLRINYFFPISMERQSQEKLLTIVLNQIDFVENNLLQYRFPICLHEISQMRRVRNLFRRSSILSSCVVYLSYMVVFGALFSRFTTNRFFYDSSYKAVYYLS